MRFASLGSGSRGNATLIQSATTTLLVDCGFSLRETESRLQRFGITAQDIDAILVTHEHGDHVKGIGAFARKYRVPVWMTYGTAQSPKFGVIPCFEELVMEQDTVIGDITVTPFSVPHDAAEPCQFKFGHAGYSLGLLTDTGMITPHIVTMLSGIDALLLECNHDVEMLAQSEYPATLKVRVGSDYGHLNNGQAVSLLQQMDTDNLKCIVAMHLSEQNNTPHLVKQSLSDALNWQTRDIVVAHQDLGLDWLTINE